MFTCIVQELATPPTKLPPVPEANIFICGNLSRYVPVAKAASTELVYSEGQPASPVANANLRHMAVRDSRGTRVAFGGSGFQPVCIHRCDNVEGE